MPPNPVDFRLANAPLTFVNDLARCAPELQNVVNVLDLRALHLERALLEDIRRKSNAQHRGSKHLDALTLARRLSRDVDALDTRETFVRLLRDVEACVKHARSLEGGETREAPARARADACATAALGLARTLEKLARACEDVVEAFAGQLGRSYFMPLALTASACASRIRSECHEAASALASAYNCAMRVREILPPPGAFGSGSGNGEDSGRMPPRELRVLIKEDGSVRLVAVGDEVGALDDALDRAWANAIVRDNPSAEPLAVDVGDDDLSELGVRVDRADASDRDVVVVAKQSQIPRAKALKYDRAVSASSALGAFPSDSANPFASKKRRRKKKDGANQDDTAKGAKKKPKQLEPPKSKEDALERLRSIGSFAW